MGKRICSIEGCDRSSRSRGWCSMHYERWLNTGNVGLPWHRSDPRSSPPCSVDGCIAEHYGKGFCRAHWYTAMRERDGLPSFKPRGTCSIEGCGKPHAAFGLCKNHHAVAYRTKTWAKPQRKPLSAAARKLRAEQAAQWRRDNPELARQRRQRAKDKRRARQANAEYEEFDRLEVFERDGWVCQICDCRVMRHRKHPDPISPSLDHIVPLAAGGPHTRSNTQLAHLRCNLMKADRVEA